MNKCLPFLIIILLFSCDGNYRAVIISGKVVDHNTKSPVANAKINIVCWVYDMDIWESRKVTKDTITDSQGEFKFLFEKGQSIDIVVTQAEYHSFKYSKNLKTNFNTIECILKRK